MLKLARLDAPSVLARVPWDYYPVDSTHWS